MNKKILIIGSLNMDMVINLKQLPQVGETVLGDNLTYVPGGKGANQTCAAGKLGGDVSMLGCVGNDTFSEILVESLKSSGADVSCIKSVPDATGTAMINVDEKGNNSIVVAAGANKKCDIKYLKSHEEVIQQSDYVVFQMEIPFDAIFYGIRKAKEYGKVIVLNPAPAPAPELLPDDIWKDIDYLTPNETELLKLSGRDGLSMDSISAGAKDLVRKGVKNVIVTLGDKGVLLVTETVEVLYPTRKVKALDTTAAGDCFNGAFVTGLSEGMSVSDAIEFANLAASIAVTRKGAQASIPERYEVDEVYARKIAGKS